MTETRLSGLVWARKEHDPLIRKHLPFLKLLSADAKQRVAPAPGSYVDSETFLCLVLALWFPTDPHTVKSHLCIIFVKLN